MVTRSLRLSNNARLEFLQSEGLWARASIVAGGRTFQLGAEDIDIALQRLQGAFKEFHKRVPQQIFSGIPVVGVHSFFEEHATLFLGREQRNFVFFIMDGNGIVGAPIAIDEAVSEAIAASDNPESLLV